MPPDQFSEALKKATDALMQATIATQRIASHEAECARRYSDSQHSYDQLRTQIFESNKEMRDTVTKSADATATSVATLQTALAATNETTNQKIQGVNKTMLGGMGALCIVLIGGIIAYVLKT